MAKTALVTGATDGVGRVVAKALGKDGWRVMVHGRDRERGESLVKEIEQAGGRATFLAADLEALAEVRRLAAEVHERAVGLDPMRRGQQLRGFSWGEGEGVHGVPDPLL